MADTRVRRRPRPTRAVVALAAPALVVSGLVLASGGTRPVQGSTEPADQVAHVASGPLRATGAAPAQAPSAQPPLTTGAGERSGQPSRVIIGRLGIRAEVLPIRVVDRTLTPPSDPGQLGWWSGGAAPGAAGGTAVLTGHTVHTGGGALNDLEQLEPGDTVSVRTGGALLAYDVRSVRILSRAAVARRHRELFRQDGPPRLMLVTCEDWDGERYLSSVIVVAVPRS